MNVPYSVNVFFVSGEGLELKTFVEKVVREELGLDKRGPAAEEN